MGTTIKWQEAWPEDRVIQLRALWDEGHSASEIGRRMGLSKNQIVGKSHRLDLNGRPSPIIRTGAAPSISKPRPIVAPKVTLPRLASDISATAPHKIPPPPKQPTLPLIQPRGRCLFLAGDQKPYRQCDQPIERGSYCRSHNLLCTVRTARQEAA